MIRWIVGSSLKFRYIIVAVAAALMFFGIARLPNTPVDVFPEFAPPRVEIQTPCLGLTAQEVESLVSVPLEQAFNGLPGLDVMRSKSIPDLSSIELLFKPGTDELRARQLVQERLATVIGTLPTWAAPPVIMPPVSSTSRVMKIGLSSKDVSLMDMSMISYWTIRARLLGVPGVANVLIWGERIKIPQVRVDPERMQAYDVSLDEVMEVTADALDVGILQFSSGAVIGTGGFVETPNQRLSIRTDLPIKSAADLAQVPIHDKKKSDGTPLRLADVADVVEDTWPLIGDAVINDGPGLMLIVQKYPWANTLDVTSGVEEAIAELRPGLPGIDIDTTIFRPADFIKVAIDNLTESLLFGAILVVIILFLFLWDWRIAMISLVIIPVSLMIALIVLNVRGSTLNVMVLAGLSIAIGAVVDDAIVDVENIVRRFRQLRKEGSTQPISKIVLDASIEVRGAIVYASLIEISALLPVFFLKGVSGSFFQPLAAAYVVAGLVSPLVALTLTPALMLILLANAPREERVSPLLPWLHRAYERALAPLIHRPQLALITIGVLVVAGLAVIPFFGQSLFPEFKERDFLMHWITKPGTSVIEERRIVTRASRELRAIPGVRNFGSHIGQALLAEETVGVNFGENWISVDPNADYETTVDAIQHTVDAYPGLFTNVETYLNERIEEVLSGASYALVVRLYGPDLQGIHEKADEVEQVLSGVDGLVDLNVQLQSEVPQVQVKVDLAAAQSYGLKPGDVRRASATLMSGEEVGDLFRDGKAYDVNVWSTPATRTSLTSIRDLPIDTPDGGHVRLGDVADVSIAPAQSVIYRENDSRRIDIAANVRGRDIGSVAADVNNALQKVEFPLGYHVEVLGEYAERQAAGQSLLLAGGVAVIAIFFLLQTSFRNWRLANLTFLTLPWALVGGVLAAFFTGGILTLGSLVGFLTILGIATRNGIMMISHFQHLEEDEGEAFGPALIVRGAKERLAPILMTALTTGLALVPLVIAGDIPGQEIEYPMAIVILGGLITSTLLNLFVVPTLYLRFGKARNIATARVAPINQPEPA
jgi:CzcA family heavy metal efflux pump